MCDTVAFPHRPDGPALFGKNSDREPGEPQILQYLQPGDMPPEAIRTAARKRPYLNNELPVLERALHEAMTEANAEGTPTFGALLSRPFWLWGAEIGVNDAGVAIGNEAVFSRRRVKGDVLLGMDILRLALHLAADAAAAERIITALVERYGQGGDGGYLHRLEYSNSFLIHDGREVRIVETSGTEVRSRRVAVPCGISNTYTDDGDWTEGPDHSSSAYFKKRDEKRLIALAARGAYRNRIKASWLAGERPVATERDLFALLRSHGTGDHDGAASLPHRGMGSLCIHTGALIRSESTASMVVRWPEAGSEPETGGRPGTGPTVWYTGNSWPCLSLYKPLKAGPENAAIPELRDEAAALTLHRRRQEIADLGNRDPARFHRVVAPLRDELEDHFATEIDRRADLSTPEGYQAFISDALTLEEEYLSKARTLF